MMMDKVEKAVIDLDGKWPGAGNYLVYGITVGQYWAAGIAPRGSKESLVCTATEFMEARKRLENKPSWGDAPEEARSLTQDDIGNRTFWMGRPVETEYGGWASDDAAWHCGKGRVFGDWRQSLEPRPQTDNKEGVEWEPGVDLPPVGAMVDIEGHGLVYGDGESGEVLGHIEGTAIVRISYGLGCFDARVLKPLKSHRDKCIEAAGDVWEQSKSKCTYHSFTKLANDLYDAGLLKLPGEET